MIGSRIRYLSDIPQVQAVALGEAPAVQFGTEVITYADLARRADAASRVLVALGVRPGDRVAWLARNCATFVEAFFGTILARACLAPINTRLAPAEIATILSDSGAGILFVGPEFLETARTASSRIDWPIQLVAIGGEAASPALAYPELRDRQTGGPLRLELQPDDDVLQLYTSGTTGAPKGVRLTNANYEAFLKVSPAVEGFDYDTGDVVLIVMPLFHVAATNITFAGLAHGCKVIILADFIVDEVLELIQREGVNRLFLAPAMLQMLVRSPNIATTSLEGIKSIGYGASPINEQVLSQAQRLFGCGFVHFYGMTESAGGGTVLTPSDHTPDRLGSCGRPWPGLEVRVCGPEGPAGPDAMAGAVGEIAMRGGTIMKGYWNRDEATNAAIVDGWLLTGDAGYRDHDGFFYVYDRVKDMIVTGGENVYAAEVENAIIGCPGVADVAVIGVPSDRWGEEVKALVVPAPGAEPDMAEVVSWARQRIAAFKVPKSVDLIDVLPRNAAGKVLRRELREPYWAGRDRRVG